MIDDDLLPYLPSLLETNSELLTNQDLQDLSNILAQLGNQSDDDAEETLNNFYIAHPRLRDELENLEEGNRAELKKVPPSQPNQSTRITNIFQELSQKVQEEIKRRQTKP
ncbi:MAG TPA: hypothetical protein DEG17_10750 [Cyanobacteria bacterium UBA11149]|nr:hypothetical protein [Cyanobacteria bacterium UBA11367]HBE56234.1 hypothetical protein [Cyanobacteria bacterium UBA11366]HBK64653.1 hypothetical protein [Cyanobacteria bacterium UBA11166]HBR76217.1 hypothetical protein [Cyanobacteria bacterium UBA11159]HBS69968.1 hypothetical protein [Cyanobacteria bacterium UBA11153]HBW89327.1 hypothetical protein [Cyanobacteria bacterium UBA11149]HCA94235.1 hypothetical protein [Cyanobacteria bacterium UBA9226]